MFENAKIGDKVWDITNGWTKIESIIPNSIWPIYTDCGYQYTFEGKSQTKDINPSLFWDEIKIEIPPKPLPKLEVDTKVLVWDSNDEIKQKRYFSHFNKDEKIVVFCSGSNSWSNNSGSISCDNWELYDETKDVQ